MGHEAPASDTGLAALIQHPGYPAQNTHHCKQERPWQGNLWEEDKEEEAASWGELIHNSAIKHHRQSHSDDLLWFSSYV